MLITEHLIRILSVAFLVTNTFYAQEPLLNEQNFNEIGRGKVAWNDRSVLIKDCLVTNKTTGPTNFEITFSAKTSMTEDQVQIWSGFGYLDRNNRYSLGLRGGNKNDLYLCRYQPKTKNKMLAMKFLDFHPFN